ncbi:hypothetical protein LVJ94_21230 [Pendulispora rubella]|uniref:Tetratricopeptide repeat protein n=1 Tax=Pendulispora rubella TaxID=2741070 RepID=A0ABZ2LFS2_9BACT
MQYSHLVFVAAGIWACAGSAWAAPRDSSAAEALFQSARQALAHGDVDTACERFAESERLDPAPGTLINLADCEERRGRIATAWQEFRDAVPMFRTGDDRIAYAEKRARNLEARVPHVVLTLATRVNGVTIHRDDVELGTATLGVSLPIDPGRHRFVVRAPGREERAVEVDIVQGQSLTVTLEAARATPAAKAPVATPATPPPQAGPRPRDGGSSQATWGYVAAGVGGAALITGIVATVGIAGAASSYKDHCRDGICDGDGMDAASRGKTWSIVAPIAFGAAAIGLGGGAYLLLTRPSPGTATSAGVSVVGRF